MYDPTLIRLHGCVVQEDRLAATRIVQVAFEGGQIAARDAVELLLVVHDGSPEMMLEAIARLRDGVSGCYRYVPRISPFLA
jgi:hypothetical protein